MMAAFCVKRRLQLFLILLSAFLAFHTSALAKPTINFNFPQVGFQGFPSFMSLTQQFIEKRSVSQMKTYTGRRVSNESLIMIYHHDATVAVVELGSQKLLLNCELIEIYNDNDGRILLEDLSKLNKPLGISFKEMLKLMGQCEQVDRQTTLTKRSRVAAIDSTDKSGTNVNNYIFPKSPLSILSGIIPGTKWCGTGDIAENYFDLGTQAVMDRCCRMHDLCPIKLRAYQTKYGLINESIYTKSHCTCDDMLFSCLKKTNTSSSQLMGSIYFNLVQVPCVTETSNGYKYRPAKEGF